MCWLQGCAEDAASLVQEALSDLGLPSGQNLSKM